MGWAVVRGDQLLASGALNLTPKVGDAGGLRYLRLARWLEEKSASWPADLEIALEDVRNHGRKDKATGRVLVGVTAAHVYGGLRAIIEAWAAARVLPVTPVGVGSWKSGIGLPGPGAPKEAVMARIKLLGYRPTTQDEADAIGVALHGARSIRWTALTAR